ncbi:hypothetical protein B6U99_01665 [Candidatus Geothermarchaeota archaeon ex4572_27]|nr:MAG: hypothetical protein B6U99_01665 [Candidatus Geothermarchaeota archaeon ex4572_27]
MLFDTGRLVKALGGVDGVLRVVANARGPVADVLVVTRRSMGVEELRDLWDAWLEYLREGRVLRILILGVCEYMALLETGSPVMRSIEEGGVVVLDRGAHVEYARKVLEKAERWLSEAEKAMYNGALDVAAAVAYAAVDLVIKAALALRCSRRGGGCGLCRRRPRDQGGAGPEGLRKRPGLRGGEGGEVRRALR